MIDIDIIRKNPEIVINNLRKRGGKEDIVKEIIKRDEEWRITLSKLNELRKRKNEINRKIAESKKNGKKCDSYIKDSKRIDLAIEEIEKKEKTLKKSVEELLLKLPNILHETVPEGEGEEDNVPIKFWGKPKVWKEHIGNFNQYCNKCKFKKIKWKPMDHQELCFKWDLIDIERAAKISGSRFYFMKNQLVILEQALIRFALDELIKEGFSPISPPYMTRKVLEEGVTSLDDFKDVIYKIQGEDLYMIPTAEHPLVGMRMEEIINPSELPLKYCGISPCFRKEAGSHGRDTKGIFRVHQFNKIEMVIFSKPEESWQWHERLLSIHENLFRKLEIPYRIVNVCTGDIGVVAAKKYDLEAWLPGQGKYREMGSCSNCTEWQSRRLNIRYFEPDGKRKFVHTLNSTAIATQRTIVAILENHQTKTGKIKIPKALRKYTGFKSIGD